MQKKLSLLTICSLIAFMSFSQNETNELKTHQYGGWFCPDNLYGFPAVDILDWSAVPVVNGRMPTQEEAQNGTSLIFVDSEKYPNAKPLDITMPKLAKYYNNYSKKEELIIVIQAISILKDSIVGFRYLNGGNGSARINDVTFLNDREIKDIAPSRFVTLNLQIEATKKDIWGVITNTEYSKTLQSIFDSSNDLREDWDLQSDVSFKYLDDDYITSAFAGELFGNQYIQRDYELGDYKYVEKFFLSEDESSNSTEFVIVCGPYRDDFEAQKFILKKWAQKVQELSEK